MVRLAYFCLQVTREGQASHAHVHEIIKGLRKRGLEIDLIEPFPGNQWETNRFKRINYYIYCQLKFIIKSILRRKYDLVYIRFNTPLIFFVFVIKFIGYPVVLEINGSPREFLTLRKHVKFLYPLYLWLLIKLCNYVDKVITVTSQLKNYYKNISSTNKVSVIPNAANAELFKPGLPIKNNFPKPYALFFGALNKWQGIDIILSALDNKNWPENLLLVIAGDGVEKKKIIEKQKLNSKLIYLGIVPYKDIPNLISNSMVCLSPKNNIDKIAETGLSPIKVYESMSCGVPVIVTEMPYISDVIRENNCGLVIPPDNAEQLSRSVKFIYENKTVACELGKNGREAILNYHSWDKRANDTYSIIISILNRKNKFHSKKL